MDKSHFIIISKGDPCYNSKSINIPSCVEDLTPSWFRQILNLEPSTTYEFNITLNPDNCVGFCSSLCRVEITRADTNDAKQYLHYKNLIIKLLPKSGFYRELTLRQEFYKTENNFYRFLLPMLTQQVPELQKYFCTCYFSGININQEGQISSALVLEDMKPAGYKALNFSEEFTMLQVEAGVDFLAKLHSSSKLLETYWKKSITDLCSSSMFPSLNYSPKESVGKWKSFFPNGFPKFDEFIRTYQLSNPTILSAHEFNYKIQDSILDILYAVVTAAKKFPTVTHIDLWRCNILVKPEQDIKSEFPLIKVIDWQTILYLDPALDLTTFLLSTLPIEQLNRQMVDNLGMKYYKLVCKELQENTLNLEPERSESDFMKFFTTYGMAFALTWFANSFDANYGCFPDYLIRFWAVFNLLYCEYDVHVFIKNNLLHQSLEE